MRIEDNFKEEVVFELGFKDDWEFLGKIVGGYILNGVKSMDIGWIFK